MADAIVSALMEQLTSIMSQEIGEKVSLVTGVSKEMKKLGNNLRAIQAVLVDAEQRQVKEEAARHWLDQLKDASYDMEDVLDEWSTARQKLQIEGVGDNALITQKMVCFFFTSPCFCFKQVCLRRDIARKIKDINENLDDIAKSKEMFNLRVNSMNSSIEKTAERVESTCVIDESDISGRDHDKNELVSDDRQKGLHIIPLSYNDLPSLVKRCFSYCAIFPKDYRINKDELVKLWMAQGYLVKKNKEMEIVGEEYFHILAKHSFFQDFEKDDLDNIRWCKMSDIVHDFAQSLSENECFSVEIPKGLEESVINSLHVKFRHSMLTLGIEASLPLSICRFQSLRTLLIRGDNVDFCSNNKVLVELFDKLTCLRSLDLRVSLLGLTKNLIREIPTNMKKLVHLRYINLSGQLVEKLPRTLCKLYNLQILDVSCCKKLTELPQGIGKLINLRYLLNHGTDSLWLMPVGITRLTNLRRLTKFIHGSRGCTIESLKNLELLQECCMCRLGNVSDVGEAKKLELEKKKNLLVLALGFDKDGEGERKNEEDEQLLEALQAPLNLKELTILDYRGNSIFPNWMILLNKMKILKLKWCRNCAHLPPLGKLPSLETLFIEGMPSVKKVGNEFLGIESSSSSSSSSIISFPKLKSLFFRQMNEWEEWDYGIEREGEIMPRLSSLVILDCPKLKALPDHLLQMTTLQRLEIQLCPILSERYRKGTGEDWPKVSHIPNILDEF